MGILCDSQIRELIGIEPFEENVKRQGKISYGVSSYGYDLRVGSVFKVFTNVNSEIVDPKRFSERSLRSTATRNAATTCSSRRTASRCARRWRPSACRAGTWRSASARARMRG